MDCGEIGRGAYGTVNKMLHKESNTYMAVKVFKTDSTIKPPVHVAGVTKTQISKTNTSDPKQLRPPVSSKFRSPKPFVAVFLQVF